MVTLEQAKIYLKLETEGEDDLVRSLLSSSKEICLDILRKTESELEADDSEIVSTAILFGLAYLYEHREVANHKELKETLYHLLMSKRKEVF
ncbi:DNA packaging protein, QLRG family [Streptococcus agalactiae LMG 14747]|uniref:DNA packaging protein, QLRG family n=3 Tax=Streptococcus TaxID=1301 RepID=V6Z681_STRAG|nr:MULTISPECIES: head-tail connector protein [Streptococcus]ESV55786.1 DNA packaging protein, QLRG family [Streptococcus agalactiae LMG 14747]NQG75364.1 phage gp6-like head-tail connector protein [Streptococcus suis]NQG79232.1 phage gp6-like head-tail connector protein [Streptococcus suis]TQE88463.1 phage gp6-like head-tail connector protein [Streptococcus suis]CYV75025.1 hypothetical phage protein%2C putative [Streptococcus suis]